MSQPFGPVYADSYDLIYHDKDYSAECNVIESIFRTYNNAIHSVLDLGCGTGNHAFPLAERGYEVVGVDRSADMLAYARRKLVSAETDGKLVFQQGDVRAVDLKGSFDAVLMMFAVLGYKLEKTEVVSALRRNFCLRCLVWPIRASSATVGASQSDSWPRGTDSAADFRRTRH